MPNRLTGPAAGRLPRLLAAAGALLLVLASLPGCAPLARAGKDVAVVATSPATIPLRGVHDALAWDDYTEHPEMPVFLAPVTIPLHLAKHAGYTVLYAFDLALSPLYLLAAIGPGDELRPIDLYVLDQGYPWATRAFPVFEREMEDGANRTVAAAAAGE